MTPSSTRLVLASASSARRAVLTDAGVPFEALSADVDEAALKETLAHETTETLSLALAEAKARCIAKAHPDALVIGADQILDLDGTRFDKPADPKEARRHLMVFRGRTHRLVSALAIVEGETVVWTHVGEARLTMRDFSDDFLDAYLAASGPEILESVGVYRLEGRGAQLFDRIEGDYFTVLGLPLLPLLGFLRIHGVLNR